MKQYLLLAALAMPAVFASSPSRRLELDLRVDPVKSSALSVLQKLTVQCSGSSEQLNTTFADYFASLPPHQTALYVYFNDHRQKPDADRLQPSQVEASGLKVLYIDGNDVFAKHLFSGLESYQDLPVVDINQISPKRFERQRHLDQVIRSVKETLYANGVDVHAVLEDDWEKSQCYQPTSIPLDSDSDDDELPVLSSSSPLCSIEFGTTKGAASGFEVFCQLATHRSTDVIELREMFDLLSEEEKKAYHVVSLLQDTMAQAKKLFPLTAFMHFQDLHRYAEEQLHPEASPAYIEKQLIRKWNSMSEQERESFEADRRMMLKEAEKESITWGLVKSAFDAFKLINENVCSGDDGERGRGFAGRGRGFAGRGRGFGGRGRGFGGRGRGFGGRGRGFGVRGRGFGVRGRGFGVRGRGFGVRGLDSRAEAAAEGGLDPDTTGSDLTDDNTTDEATHPDVPSITDSGTGVESHDIAELCTDEWDTLSSSNQHIYQLAFELVQELERQGRVERESAWRRFEKAWNGLRGNPRTEPRQGEKEKGGSRLHVKLLANHAVTQAYSDQLSKAVDKKDRTTERELVDMILLSCSVPSASFSD